MIQEKKGFAAIIPFNDWVKFKEQWHAQNPNVKIIEEFKNVSQAMVEVPDPQLIGKVKQVPAIAIIWAVVYIDIIVIGKA
jgi:hypothetical protein